MHFKSVFLFGGTGSLGHAVHTRWASKVDRFIVFGRDESKHWKLRRRFPHLNIVHEIGDIGDYASVKKALVKHNPQIIIVMSAMKHIDLCENFIHNCIQTNVVGLLNVVDVVDDNQSKLTQLEKILFVSTDKACAPVNVYGMSKGMAEHVVRNRGKTCCVPIVGVRYGNVLNSSGSVIPIFQTQSENPLSTHLTITDNEMTRFVISLSDSVRLIEDALLTGKRGEIFIPILPSMRIKDLAHIFSKHSQKPVQTIGIRNGEKLHESMYSDLEYPFVIRRTIEGRKRYILSPDSVQICDPDTSHPLQYSSEQGLMSPDILEIRISDFLPITVPEKIYVFGASGMLGSYVTRYFSQQNLIVIPVTRNEFTVTEEDTQETLLDRLNRYIAPDHPDQTVGIINCMGLTNKVTHSHEFFLLVNGIWPFVLGTFGETHNIPIVHASTDCVFKGHSLEPYTERSPLDSTDTYGISKIQGDQHPWLSVVRTSIIGESKEHKEGLIEWFKQTPTVHGYTNHYWNGITCLEWAKITYNILKAPHHGVIHIVPPYVVTKHHLLELINEVYDLGHLIKPMEAAERNFKVLDSVKGLVCVNPDLRDQLVELKKFIL